MRDTTHFIRGCLEDSGDFVRMLEAKRYEALPVRFARLVFYFIRVHMIANCTSTLDLTTSKRGVLS